MEGTGAKMRQVKVRSAEDAEKPAIRRLIKEVLAERKKALDRWSDSAMHTTGQCTFWCAALAGKLLAQNIGFFDFSDARYLVQIVRSQPW